MKKFIALSLSLLMLCSNVFAGEISVSLNGESVEFANQEPVIVEGRTLIPLRGVFEKLGYEISWDGNTKTAEFVNGNKKVQITVNSDTFIVDDDMVFTLDVPAQIINGSMMLPLRAVGEAAGIDVEWDAVTKTVNLSAAGSVLDDNVEFKFDSESGKAALKPKESTEGTTETVTEAKVKEEKAYQRPLTDEEKKAADDYILYIKTESFCKSYLSVLGDYIDELNSYNSIKEEDRDKIKGCLEEVIAVNNCALQRIKTISNSKVNNTLYSSVLNLINKADNLYSAMLKNCNANKKYIYDSKVAGLIEQYNSAFSHLWEDAESNAKEYIEGTENWNWNYDELSDTEEEEVRAYQKQAGEIIERNLLSGGSFNFSDIKNNNTEKVKAAAEAIAEEMSQLNVPERCRIDNQILVSGTEFLKESAEIKASQSYDDPDCVYPAALTIAFDYCAKTCAGDYYTMMY